MVEEIIGLEGTTRRRRSMSRSKVAVVTVAAAASAAAVFVFALRPTYMRWGATEGEAGAPMPGDDLIPDADLSSTRAVTVEAPAERIWPWLAQMGQGRGGLYSYDALENLVGCDMHSADRIVPEWQDVAVGSEVRLHPEVALAVEEVDPGSALVLRGGVQMGDVAPPYDFTWAFALRERPDGTTRLLIRERYEYTRPWARLLVEPVEAVSFVMSRKMLRGIRDRAERADGSPVVAVD
jgi:hypothetical protein